MVLKSSPLVSVVTPVYNNEEDLPECIESVLAQTYQNWDYSIVNNCSTDKSGKSRVALLPKTRVLKCTTISSSYGWSRTITMRYGRSLRKSKYCKMVFADDLIFPHCIEEMVAVAEEHPSVGFVGAYGLDGRNVLWAGLPYPCTVIAGRELCRRLFLDGLMYSALPPLSFTGLTLSEAAIPSTAKESKCGLRDMY